MKINRIPALAAILATFVVGLAGCNQDEPTEEGVVDQPAELETTPDNAFKHPRMAKHLKMFEEADKDKDGKVTLDEIRAAAAAEFAGADGNKDGFLDLDEMKNLRGKHKRSFDKVDRGARKLKRFDQDGNGSLSRAEAPPFLQDRFDDVDTNKDGVLNQEELQACHKKMGKKGHGRMARMDKDGDGKVSSAEFTEAAVQRLNRVDANKDGILTREEVEKYRPM
jgi:Ca2+-binding EF-hand superfamily protein